MTSVLHILEMMLLSSSNHQSTHVEGRELDDTFKTSARQINDPVFSQVERGETAQTNEVALAQITQSIFLQRELFQVGSATPPTCIHT